MLTLDQLISPRTSEQIRARLIQSLQGVGFVRHTGTGTGTIHASGVSTTNGALEIEILSAGEPGNATLRYSLDGGVNWISTITLPVGEFSVPNTGCVLSFLPGPETEISFHQGDRYSLTLTRPTFPATSWQAGSLPLTLLENDASVIEDLDVLANTVARGGLLEYSTGAWLDLLALNVYDLTRGRAVATRGYLVLTDTGQAGPFEISVGQLWAITGLGLRYNSITSGTVPRGGSVSILFQAECPGAQYNVGPGAITSLATPLPGVTCVNPPNWFSLDKNCYQGADAEGDPALRSRCKGRWSELGIGATAQTYDYWARTATANPGPGEERITRTQIRTSFTMPGEVEVYLGGDAGPSNSVTVEAVHQYILPRIPLTSMVLVKAANTVVVKIAGTISVFRAKHAVAQASAHAAFVALFQSIPIGGARLVGGFGVSREAIINAIAGQEGVSDVNLTSPISDISMSIMDVALIGAVELVWNEI